MPPCISWTFIVTPQPFGSHISRISRVSRSFLLESSVRPRRIASDGRRFGKYLHSVPYRCWYFLPLLCHFTLTASSFIMHSVSISHITTSLYYLFGGGLRRVLGTDRQPHSVASDRQPQPFRHQEALALSSCVMLERAPRLGSNVFRLHVVLPGNFHTVNVNGC